MKDSQDGVPPLPASLTGRIWVRYHALNFLLRSGTGYLRNSLANVVKRALGRPAYLDQTEIFFRAFLLGKLGFAPMPAITARGQLAIGIGNQVRFVMCAINFARALRVPYVHTPFDEIAHADRPMADWAKHWENEFNLGAGELQASAERDDLLDFTRLAGPLVRRFGHSNIFEMLDFTAGEFRRKYYLNKEKQKSAILRVGIHIRRGDETSENTIGRWTEMANVLTSVRRVTDALMKRNIRYRLSVFSEGDPGDFRELAELGAELNLNRDVAWTMREMIESDILVMGKGWFSYIAAVISDGIRLYDPWYDVRPMKDWLVLDGAGGFDALRFGGALDGLLAKDSGSQKRRPFAPKSE